MLRHNVPSVDCLEISDKAHDAAVTDTIKCHIFNNEYGVSTLEGNINSAKIKQNMLVPLVYYMPVVPVNLAGYNQQQRNVFAGL